MKKNGAGQIAPLAHPSPGSRSQAVTDIFAAEVEIKGLTPRQFVVLMTVAQNEGLS